jgi:hypothetical protein
MSGLLYIIEGEKMKNKKDRIVGISILAIFLMILTPLLAQASEKLQIRIWTDKDQFFVQEPIPVYYDIKNISASTQFLSFGMVEEDFVIKDEQGRGYSTHLRGSFGGRDSLKPGESFHTSLDIAERYGLRNIGEYICYIHTQPSAVLDFGWIKSNTIKFKVIEPKGDEKKALDLYLEAEKLSWCKDKDPKKWEQAFYRYLELADKYPKSVYAPVALYASLFKAHVIKDKNVVVSVCKKLIENYPESYYIDDAFYNLVGNYKVLKDKTGAMVYMEGLTKKHPNTKISERAKYWLEKTEKQEFK